MTDMTVVPVTAMGRRFRSTTEARWATFLTELMVPWAYEPETYDLGPLGWYMPDFHLPTADLFLEVKPPGTPTIEAADKAEALADLTGSRVAIACGFGMPTEVDYPVLTFRPEDPGCLIAYRRGGRVSGHALALCECGFLGLEWDHHGAPGEACDMWRRVQRIRMWDAYEAGASFRADRR